MAKLSAPQIHNFKIGNEVNVLDYNPFRRTYFVLGRGRITGICKNEDTYKVKFTGRDGLSFTEKRYVDPCAQGDLEPVEQYIAKLNS